MHSVRRAIFWDRDGTLIEDRGHLANPDDVVFLPGAIDALRLLAGDLLYFIVTHQPGVAWGKIGLDDVARVNARVLSRLEEAGVPMSAVYVCPHAREDLCSCIKPKPYFLRQAASRHDLCLRRSFVVGDHPHDVELARRAGARGLYVCTGHGRKHLPELPKSNMVFRDVLAAARWIAQHSRAEYETAPQHQGNCHEP